MSRAAAPQRPKVRRLPEPDTCPVTHKDRWPDKRAAVEVLHRAQVSRRRAEEAGLTSRRQECRTYRCPFCAGWHTTSQTYRYKATA